MIMQMRHGGHAICILFLLTAPLVLQGACLCEAGWQPELHHCS